MYSCFFYFPSNAVKRLIETFSKREDTSLKWNSRLSFVIMRRKSKHANNFVKFYSKLFLDKKLLIKNVHNDMLKWKQIIGI